MIEKTLIVPPNNGGNGDNMGYRVTTMTPKRRYGSYLRERWWVLLVTLTLAVGSMFTYKTLQPAKYSSHAQLHFTGDIQLMSAGMVSEDSQNYFGTQIELLKSPRLRRAAYERVPDAPGTVDQDIVIEVFQPMRTSILQLRATGSDAAFTQRFLQALIDVYRAYKKDTRQTSSEDLVISLNEQVTKNANLLKGEQDKWIEFQKTNNMAVLEEEGKSAGLYLAQLNLELAKLQLERELMDARISLGLRTKETTNAVIAMPESDPESTAGSDAVKKPEMSHSSGAFSDANDLLRSVQLELAMKKADLQVTRQGKPTHDLTNDIARLERTLVVLNEQSLSHSKTELEELDKRIVAIKNTLPNWEAKVLDINSRLSESQRFKNNIQRQQAFIDQMSTMLQNVDVGRHVQQERVSELQSATSAQPSEEKLVLFLALATALGLFMGLGIVFAWYLLDDRFVSVRDIKDQFGEPVLGLVPQIRVPRSKPERALVEANDSRRAYSESFRHLRSALLLAAPRNGADARMLLFTSAMRNEGKTTLSVNMARVLTRSGLRVALVDADLHGEGITRLVHTPSEIGLLDYLRGEAEASAIVQATDIPGLTVVGRGTGHLGSEGALLRPQLHALLNSLRHTNDFVILDAAPVLTTDNSALLVPHADAIILVTRPFHTHARLMRQALDMMYQRQAKHVAIILNRARSDDLSGYYAAYGTNSAGKNGTNGKS